MKKIVSILLICMMLAGCAAREETLGSSAAEETSSLSADSTDIGETSSVSSSAASSSANAGSTETSSSASAASSAVNTSSAETSSASSSAASSTADTSGTESSIASSSTVSAVSSPAASTTESLPVIEESAWVEEAVNKTMYVNKDGVFARKKAVRGSAEVKRYVLNDKVVVVAKTNTDYYKLEDGSFIHADYLSDNKTSAEPSTPPSSGTSSIEELLNSAKLNPMKTNEDDLDVLVDDILGRITNDSMSTYQKVVAIYDYIINTCSYGHPPRRYTSELNYHMMNDNILASRAYTLITEKKGVCDDYSSLFVVLTRAIGLESYTVSGQVASKAGGTTGHTWTNVKLNGKYYIFDPQVEQDNTVNGHIPHNYFCRTDESLSGVYTYEVSFIMEICAMYCDPINENDPREYAVKLFGDFVVDEGERPYAGWSIGGVAVVE